MHQKIVINYLYNKLVIIYEETIIKTNFFQNVNSVKHKFILNRDVKFYKNSA